MIVESHNHRSQPWSFTPCVSPWGSRRVARSRYRFGGGGRFSARDLLPSPPIAPAIQRCAEWRTAP